jgi:hypothetical protein
MKKPLAGGQSRIAAAKSAVASALAEIPAGVRLGLLLYGHRRAKDCSDIELVSSIGSEDAASISARIQALEARGETPIADALSQSVGSFAGVEGQSNRVVLVTDGIEECGGDPCAAASQLAAAGLDLKVDVVGFTLTAEQRQSMQCIPELTGGTYHDAQDLTGLVAAMTAATKVAEPEPPKAIEHFRDDFDGQDLAEAWEVLNPDPEAYAVEDGQLLVVAPGKAATLFEETVSNVFRLSDVLPDGDWTLTARILPKFQTGQEHLILGLYNGGEDYLVSSLVVVPDKYYGHKFYVRATKRTGTEETSFDQLIFRYGCNVCDDATQSISHFVKDVSKPVLLSLKKEGRSYAASAQWEGMDDKGQPYPVVRTEKVTSLRGRGSPIIGLTQAEGSNGESLIQVDWVKIEIP